LTGSHVQRVEILVPTKLVFL